MVEFFCREELSFSENSHSKVFLCEDSERNKMALKCCIRDHSDPDYGKYQSMYWIEYTLLSNRSLLKEANIPLHHRYIDDEEIVIGERTYELGIIMDYLPHIRLHNSDDHDCVRKAREVRAIMQCLIKTIQTTNALGYYHLDLSLNNILLDTNDNGKAWLLDYTGAKYIGKIHIQPYDSIITSARYGHVRDLPLEEAQAAMLVELYCDICNCTIPNDKSCDWQDAYRLYTFLFEERKARRIFDLSTLGRYFSF